MAMLDSFCPHAAPAQTLSTVLFLTKARMRTRRPRETTLAAPTPPPSLLLLLRKQPSRPRQRRTRRLMRYACMHVACVRAHCR